VRIKNASNELTEWTNQHHHPMHEDGGVDAIETLGAVTLGGLVTSTSTTGYATTATFVPDSTRTNYAFSMGNRAAELTVNLANAASQNLELFQANVNLTASGGAPTSTSAVRLVRIRSTHDTVDMSNLRLMNINTYMDVRKSLQDAYGQMNGIDFYTNAITVGGEAAVAVFNVDANSAVTGDVRGAIINVYGGGLPASTSIGLEVRTDGGAATLAEGIRIWSVGGNSINYGLYIDGTINTADIRFHHGTTLLDDGTDLTLAGANLVLGGDLIPSTDDSKYLGSSTLGWKGLHFPNILIKEMSSSFIEFRNNADTFNRSISVRGIWFAESLTARSTAAGLAAYGAENAYMNFNAYDAEIQGSVVVGKLQGASDPYFGLGGSAEAKFYNSGLIEIGAFTAGGDIIGQATYDLGSAASPFAEAYIGNTNDYLKVATVDNVPTLYGAGAYLRIGNGGTTQRSLTSEDDLLITGKLEIRLGAYFNSQFNTYADIIMYSGGIYIQSDGLGINAPNVNNYYLLLKARDNDNARVEVARLQGATDPYFAMGGSREFKFYYSGVATLGGAVTLSDVSIINLKAGTSAINPEVAHRGQFYFTEGATNVADKLYCIMKGTDNNYSAIQVAIG